MDKICEIKFSLGCFVRSWWRSWLCQDICQILMRWITSCTYEITSCFVKEIMIYDFITILNHCLKNCVLLRRKHRYANQGCNFENPYVLTVYSAVLSLLPHRKNPFFNVKAITKMLWPLHNGVFLIISLKYIPSVNGEKAWLPEWGLHIPSWIM